MYYCIHKSLLPVPPHSQINPVHTPHFHSLKFHLNIILPSTPKSSKCPLFLSIPTKTLYVPLPISVICPIHIILYLIA